MRTVSRRGFLAMAEAARGLFLAAPVIVVALKT